MSFPAVVDLDAIAAGSGGFKIQGENEHDFAGHSVSVAGDVNGDGIADLIIGAPSSRGESAGAAYVVFGSTAGFTSPVDLGAIAGGSGGFKIQGENALDRAGYSVSAAGDVDGDGIDDLIVGAVDFTLSGYGAAYVVFGRADGFASPIGLDAVAAGSGGFKIEGESAGDFAGESVSAAGDVNGDGIDDVIVGTDGSGGTDAGAAYVVFGRTGGFASPVDLDDAAAGSGGFKIQGENGGDNVGYSVSAAGDVNGDGIDDLVIGSSGNVAYVVFGSTGGFTSPVDLSDIGRGSGGFEIQGEEALDGAGFSVSAAGDVNGDGIGDLIVGAPFNGGGAAYVVFGRTGGFGSSVDLAAIAAGSGFKIQGENAFDQAGRVVSAAGDVNGDGVDDLIVGAPDNGGDFAGAAYIIFGRRDEPFTLFTGGDDSRDLNDFDLALFPGALATKALAGDDTVILSETQNRGVAFFGNAGDDRITGSSHGDRIFGGSGRDRLRGEGGRDSLDGGAGSDLLYGGLGNDLARGGNGADGLFGFRGDDRLDGGAGNDRLGGDGGRDRLYGGDGEDRLYGGDGDDRIVAGQDDDRLFGGWGDDLLSGGAGRDLLSGGDGDDVFRFAFAAHSRPGAADRVADFEAGDLIDLSRIDAVAGGGDDAFVFIGGADFTAPGQLRSLVVGESTFLQGNTTNSGGTELLIAISGVHAIGEDDLVL